MVNAAPRWATRCTSCGTSFRVTEEQLQVSEGHVRCGRCDAVFNARGSLFDLDAPASALAPFTPAAPAPAAAEPVAEAPIESKAETNAALGHAPKALGNQSLAVTAPAGPAWDGSKTESPDPREPQWDSTVGAHADADAAMDPNARLRDLLGVSPANERSGEHGGHLREAGASSAHPEPAPSQWSSLEAPVRRRSTTRKSRFASSLLITAAALLALALPMQWAWIEQAPLRARYPALDAWLSQHFSSLSNAGWRHLEGLTVASSALQATPQGAAYALELVVSNRAPHRLAMPSLDLSLTDTQGQLLLRRTLSPEELDVKAQLPLAAGEQRKLQAVFLVQGASARVSGYELGLFHP